MRVYIDAMLVIYLVEQNTLFAPAVEQWLKANPCDLVSSELGRMECLVVPVRNSDQPRITDFEHFFQSRISEFASFTRAVYDRAVRIRAQFRFKTPDALHLAAAIEAGCDLFLTNDQHLAQFTGITVEVI